ncbi:hypothetical protein SAMN04488004_1389 [Loktanella salsilacus]|uniref:Tetratricopeptide repeat-containing protein n=1 Tax=Loktanella salsilacus TaxID=195913 RepID=A0A1I4JJ84_9RHOB|nr:hypothetical protein [Loktanella salsilacus]SFL66263.1 hypothetical protein SAMN04488004_1389 [Loktanella salsilacus]
MQRYVLAISAICLLAVGVVVLLQPDPMVRLEAELASLEPRDALDRLAAAEKAGPLSRNLYLMHARLDVAHGNFEAAHREYLRVLVDASGHAKTLDEMAELAALRGDLTAAVRLRKRGYFQAPDMVRRQDLGYLLRLSGNSRAEMELLQDVSPRQLTPFEQQRLSELLLASGDIAAYRDVLVFLSNGTDETALTARRQLLQLDIETGQPDQAMARASDWNTAAPADRDTLDQSLRTLIGRGATTEALTVAERSIVNDPEIGDVSVDAFLAAGYGGIGRHLQTLWLDADPNFDLADWLALALNAERSGDMAALRRALARHTTGDAPPPPAVFLQMLRYQGARALLPYRAFMTPDLFSQMPLLGAAWCNLHRDMPQTFAYLRDAVNATDPLLTEWDRQIWMLVAQDLRGTPYYRDLLSGPLADSGITTLLRASVLGLVPTSFPAAAPAATGD